MTKARKSQKMSLYEYTLEETAQELGCSPERVQQILNEAIAKIRRNPAHIEILREYWQWSTGADKPKDLSHGME